MRALSTAIYQVLVNDASLAALLGEFSDKPSVFTKRPVPKEATRPVVLADTVVADTDEDFLNSQGRRVLQDVSIYGTSESSADVDKVMDAAERVRTLFHRKKISVSGFSCLQVVVTGPMTAPVDTDDEFGLVMTLTVQLRKTP